MMRELSIHQTRGRALAIDPESNPEGKGINGFLLDWLAKLPKLPGKAQGLLLSQGVG